MLHPLFRPLKNGGLFGQVITGCRPFNNVASEGAVMGKVLTGGRPNRPPSGFTDPLWELLKATWLVECGSESSESPKRPQTSTILSRLNGEVNNWGKLIVPPCVTERTFYHAANDSRSLFHDVISCSGANLRTKQLRTTKPSIPLSRPEQTQAVDLVPAGSSTISEKFSGLGPHRLPQSLAYPSASGRHRDCTCNARRRMTGGHSGVQIQRGVRRKDGRSD